LIFDDLPAQDDATVRRGRPAAHLVYDEGSVQIAALSMISSGFGLLAQLDRQYPAHKVTEVIAYVGTVLGPERLCRGQNMDLRMGSADGPAPVGEILEMYDLKTSTAIEASLVPLMMVLDRPPAEVALVKQYAYHAGIVFQIRDDILDATSSTEILGKDADNDVGKVNIVRILGLAEATRLMNAHVADAVGCCERLPFDADLLAGMARYFAARRR
jgi:geranylgeranyl pyrophosphate synthase